MKTETTGLNPGHSVNVPGFFLGYVNPAMRFLPGGTVDHSLFFEDNPRVQGSLPRYQRGGSESHRRIVGRG